MKEHYEKLLAAKDAQLEKTERQLATKEAQLEKKDERIEKLNEVIAKMQVLIETFVFFKLSFVLCAQIDNSKLQLDYGHQILELSSKMNELQVVAHTTTSSSPHDANVYSQMNAVVQV
jgi:hypothetical protein